VDEKKKNFVNKQKGLKKKGGKTRKQKGWGGKPGRKKDSRNLQDGHATATQIKAV